MNNRRFSYRDLPLYSPFFAHYAEPSPESDALVAAFFSASPHRIEDYAPLLQNLTADSRSNAYDRPALCELLTRQNHAFGCGEKTFERIAALGKPNAVTVVTGQQVGLLTGSLYTIYKTLSALTLAEKLKAHYPDFEFVPVFWLEGEDHDYAEMSSVSILSQNKTQHFTYREPRYAERQMLSRTRFSPDIYHFITDFLSSLQPSDFKTGVSDLIRSCYKEGETFSTAFAKTMAQLFKDDGLVFIESDDKAFKRLAKSVFIKELQTQPQSGANLVSQSATLEEMGYAAQVKPRPVNFYVIENDKRLSVEPPSGATAFEPPDSGMTFELMAGKQTVTSFSKPDLVELTTEQPERLSSNVVTRPLVQDAVFPTLCYVAGPAEAAYFAQFRTNYEFFSIPMPVIVPRATLTLVESKIAKAIDKFGLSAADFFSGKSDALKRALEKNSGALNIDAAFGTADTSITAALKKLETELRELDPTLGEAMQGSIGKVLHPLGSLKEKAHRAEKQKNAELVSQIEKCAEHLFPDDSLQERTLNIFYFLNKYGFSFLTTLKTAISEQDATAHLIVEL